ncbi:TaqI-like C-terminal specificity domain-containing protein [uncultured Bacteroides sp.]|uniref:Eco57I restriction-modification methylase domain-containing protein n=1 Tax=uncultured Bacteroides sp. TaxID=162156 RepID=UPI00263A09EA|nr:TaqI-like C-terminal specificity domain-containing protein [uncultured Bacteroides sp.]
MELKYKLEKIFNDDYPGNERFIADVIEPIFGNEIEYIDDDLTERKEYAEKAKNAGIKHIRYVGDLTEKNYNAENIALLDVTLDDSKNIERSRVNIQQLIRSIMDYRQHLMIVFHYKDITNKQWRFSYAHKGDSLKDSTSAKRYTYVFGRGYRGRTAAERFEVLAKSPRNDKDFEEAFSVAALSDEFFDKYRNIYADFVQYITGKRYEKIKNKWEEVKKEDPNTEIFSQFNNDDKRVRDYIKKMLGRLTFLCFLQRKGWMNNDRNFLQNLYQTSPLQTDFLDSVLEPLFFGVLNTPPEKRKEVFAKNGWNTDLADEWGDIPYLNGGLFEQTREDKLTIKFPKKLFLELFKFLGEYNFTIDENDPDDAEIGIDPEMLGRVFESLLEDNKDKGAFYTPKEIVQYMCRQSIIEYLKTHTDQSLYADIEDLINKGLVNHALQNKNSAKNLYKLLKEVTVCDPAIGSGAFPMGILNILFTARQHLYGFLKETKPFNPLEVKKTIIRDNIYGVDIEQGAVDIARLRFWLAILVEEQVAMPLPNLDYRIVRGNSLITTFNNEYIKLPETPDGRTKLAKLKKELHQLQNDLFDLNGDKKFQREIEIKCKILEIIKAQLGIDKANAQEESKVESDIFEYKKLSGKALKKAKQARIIEEVKSKSLFALNNLITSLTTPATSLADRAQIDIKFFDWKIVFSNIFSKDTNASGFDIVIGNPPYGVSIKSTYRTNVVDNHGQVPDYEIYYYFIEIANKLLHDNGVLSYIIPNTYLFNTYATNYRLHILKDWAIVEILDCTKFPIFKSAVVRNTINLWRKDKNHSEVGYRNTTDIKSFDDLIAKSVLSIGINDLIKLNQNWALAFSLTPEKTQIITKISSTHQTISELFPEISQGLIAYDKYRGQSQEIIKNRSYHHSVYRIGLKKWMWGEDVHRFRIHWNGKEYIDYCDGIANPRNPKFFMGKRILIREITNPSIFAALTDKELYHDPAVIVVKDNNIMAIEAVLGILNSKMATFFHFNHSPKATKGAFPKILVQDIKDFPIPDISERIQEIIIKKVNDIMRQNPLDSQSDVSVIEKDIDEIVYHLYDLTYDEVLIIDPQTPISREEYESFSL